VVARVVSGDLCRRCSVDALLAEMFFDLFPTRAGCFQIFLSVAFDLGLSMLTALDFIAQPFKPQSQLGTVNGSCAPLRSKEFMWLQGSRLAVVALGHIEDDGMGMQLRDGIPIDRPCCVVLEGCGCEFACRFRRVNIADASLRVLFQFSKCNTHTLAMCFPHAVITSYKCGNRNLLRCGKGRIPSGAMLNACDLLAAFTFVGP
jgi:hypothetical protein